MSIRADRRHRCDGIWPLRENEANYVLTLGRHVVPDHQGRRIGDNVAVDCGEQGAIEILEAIRSGRDLYVFDEYIVGPQGLRRARELLIEKRDTCADPDAAFLTGVILGLEKGDDGEGPSKVRLFSRVMAAHG